MSDKEFTSYEISRELHDKGFRAEHGSVHVSDGDEFSSHGIGEIAKKFTLVGCEGIPAYTFTELWGVLPAEVNENYLLLEPHRIAYWSFSGSATLKGIVLKEPHKSPAEACALLILWLLNNGYEVKG